MPEGTEAAPAEAKKKSPILTIAIVAVVMVLEGVAALGFIMFSGGGPSKAEAQDIEGAQKAEEEQTVEIKLVEGRFQNMASGRAWTWAVDIVLQTRKKDEERVKAELDRRSAEITEGVGLIIRRAAHSHLTEPGLETLHRQIDAYVQQIFGATPAGDPYVTKVLIPKCQGTPPE
ncbi:MAG: hypothetical protein IPJ41_14400 [Phycisphaerales bacterium]|nr:hypothetical protein [Phycisphaerales bacterium]